MTDHPKVVLFDDGSPFVQKGEPTQDIVDLLKEMLENAESGQICGIAVDYLIDDGTLFPMANSQWAVARGHGLGALLETAISRLKRRFEQAIDG
jgi:hypothetical protein